MKPTNLANAHEIGNRGAGEPSQARTPTTVPWGCSRRLGAAGGRPAMHHRVSSSSSLLDLGFSL